MKLPVFVTGNAHKAAFLAAWLGVNLEHQKIELDELQSLDLHEIAEHKARQAYGIIHRPVLIEDVSLEIQSLGGLPGTFIKWFLARMTSEQICSLVGYNRSATAKVCYCLYDGSKVKFFDGEVSGKIVRSPSGDRGFGFDPIFIPNTAEKTWGEMTATELETHGLRTTTVYPALRSYFSSTTKHNNTGLIPS